jgi:hypothetical protein
MKKSTILIVFPIAILLGALAFYFLSFNQRLSPDNSDWGSFGGYLAGTVGVIFSLLSFFLICFTFYEQRKIAFENTFHQLIRNYNNLINLIHERWLHKDQDDNENPTYRNGREIFGNAVGYLGQNDQKGKFIEIYSIHINVFQHYFDYLLEVIETIRHNTEIKPAKKREYYRRFSSNLSFFELVMLAYYSEIMLTNDLIGKIIKDHFIYRLFDLKQTEKIPHKEQVDYIVNQIKH